MDKFEVKIKGETWAGEAISPADAAIKAVGAYESTFDVYTVGSGQEEIEVEVLTIQGFKVRCTQSRTYLAEAINHG